MSPARKTAARPSTGTEPPVTTAATVRYAVVREDPELEADLCLRLSARRVLVVASGGCTALTLKARLSDLEITAFDNNPAQLDHVRHKADVVASGGRHAPALLNVEVDNPNGLNQSGEFEKLFRTLRRFIEEFVAPAEELRRFFSDELTAQARTAMRKRWFASRYWQAAFSVAFNDPLLHAMFGPAATQHAAPGSYPEYFRELFERGLSLPKAAHNPFLQHVLIGCYRAGDAPLYTTAACPLDVELVLGGLEAVPYLDRFDLVSLSNVFDWSDDALVSAWIEQLREALRPGAAVLVRQLNNQRDLSRWLTPGFRIDESLGTALRERDRSLFYNRIIVALRTRE